MIDIETVTEKLFLCAALVSVSIVIIIFGFLVFFSFPLIAEGHFFGLLTKSWMPTHGSFGIYPMIAGTLFIACSSIAIAFPVSLGCACLITVFSSTNVSWLVRKVVQLMTGIPTVIYGFVGIFLLVPLIRELFDSGSGMCVLAASLMLALMISPTMILFFSDSFEHVPQSYCEAVDSLGGTRVQKLLYVIIPCAWRGILTGTILSLGRALGDTLIALMIAGNAIQVPGSVLDSARTLTSHIALVIAADYDSLEFKSIFACGMLLYLFTVVMVLLIKSLESVARGSKL